MKTIMEQMKMWKKRQIISVILIVCLLGSVVLSDHIYGVFATTDPVENLLNGGEYASPSNASKKNHKNQDEYDWEYASSSNASHSNADWSDASPSNASPSNALEYEQLTLEDDSEPVTVSGKLPVGTRLIAEPIPEEELLECGMEELELETASVAFAYRITLWLNGVLYQPEYNLTVSAENMDLMDGELNLIQLETDEQDQITGYHAVPCSTSKEGIVSFTMTKLGSYAAIDMGNPDKVQTITDADGHVMISGEFPETITVTAETLSEDVLSQMELPEGDITFAYDVKLWKNEKEYKLEKPVKVTLLNPENAVDVQAQSLDAENESETEASTENADQENRITLFSVATDEQGMLTEKQTVEDSADEAGNLSFVTEQVAAYVGVEQSISVNSDEIKSLIDADVALLEWKAEQDANDSASSFTIEIDGEATVVSADTYEDVSAKLFEKMTEKATSCEKTIPETTISEDMIWNVSDGTKLLNGNLVVESTGRLVILGNGSIQKNGDFNIQSTGIVIFQGDVIFDGNQKSSAFLSVNAGNAYLADQFTLKNNNASGIVVSGGIFKMVGGLIGTKDLLFKWHKENNSEWETKDYNATLQYIDSEPTEYCYINSIEIQEPGCTNGVSVQYNGEFLMTGGVIAGNSGTDAIGISNSGKTTVAGGLIIGNVSEDQGAGISSNGTFNMTGGSVIANIAGTYCCGVNVAGTKTTIGIGEAGANRIAKIAYNSAAHNGGGIGVQAGAVCTLEEGALITHNTAIGSEKNKNNTSGTGNGGGIRVSGTLIMEGGTVSYNYANGRNTCPDVLNGNSGMGGGINGQRDDRNANIVLNGGTIQSNKSTADGGGVYLTCLAGDNAVAQIDINNTEIIQNSSVRDGGGVYLSARNGSLVSNITTGKIMGNVATGSGGGVYIELGTLNTGYAKNVTVNIGSENSNEKLHILENNAGKLGGGLCVVRANANKDPNNTIEVNLHSGNFNKNEAQYGGAIGVWKGTLNISGGTIEKNIASENGGGAYVAGGNLTLDETKSAENKANDTVSAVNIRGNQAMNGGGFYVTDGNITMYHGLIANNESTQAGGGMFVNGSSSDVTVCMLSGTFSENTAGTNGGAIAVNAQTHAAKIQVGVCENHLHLTEAGGKFDAFPYDSHTHESCPFISGNRANDEGGGLYADGGRSSVAVYCATVKDNKASKQEQSDGFKVNGGAVVIGAQPQGEGNTVYGNVLLENTVLVTGGTVDVYGTMTNPYFTKPITVQVQNVTTDRYIDHRTQDSNGENEQYKIIYYENFKGDNAVATGTYKAYQYKKGASVRIESAAFVHPGWRIKGWSIEKDGTDEKPYTANSAPITLNDDTYGMDKTKKELRLYAIWEACRYIVSFEPNVPLEVAYTGTMENQSCTVNQPAKLNKNQYRCMGYRFMGWNTRADGTGDFYSDEGEITQTTIQSGEQIRLYAQWKLCDHKGEDELQYSLNQDKTQWTQSCVCGNHTTTATLDVLDTVYDGTPHTAQIRYQGDPWIDTAIDTAPVIVYEWSSTANGVYYEMTASEGEPVNAKYYQAKMQVGDADSSPVSYHIEKAEQNAPGGRLSYTYENGTLTITPPSLPDKKEHGEQIYELRKKGETETTVQSSNTFKGLEEGATYYIYAYYKETDNYLQSGKIEAVLSLKTQAVVTFQLDQGITVTEKSSDQNDYLYQVVIDEGYHKDGFCVNVSDDSCKFENTSTVASKAKVEEYKLTVPNSGSAISVVVSITGVTKDAGITAKKAVGQYFEDFLNDESLEVDADSAFTMQFDVRDCKTGDYFDPKLVFSPALPENTSIIMQADGDYWYATTKDFQETDSKTISLTSFHKMGDSLIHYPYTDNTERTYRFVVDFSKDGVKNTGSCSATLSFSNNESVTGKTEIPELTRTLTVELKKSSSIAFEMSSDDERKTVSAQVTYSGSDTSVSAWKDRTMGILVGFASDKQPEIPSDLRLAVTYGDETTLYPMNSNKQFAVSLGEVSKKDVTLSLRSATSDMDDRTYGLTAQLYVSGSAQGSSMLSGETIDSPKTFWLKLERTVTPSIKIETSNNQRLYSTGATMNYTVSVKNTEGCEIDISIMGKPGFGQFDEDMMNPDHITGSSQYTREEKEFLIPEKAGPESYCILVTATKNGATILRVPYYFIAADNIGENAS